MAQKKKGMNVTPDVTKKGMQDVTKNEGANELSDDGLKTTSGEAYYEGYGGKNTVYDDNGKLIGTVHGDDELKRVSKDLDSKDMRLNDASVLRDYIKRYNTGWKFD